MHLPDLNTLVEPPRGIWRLFARLDAWPRMARITLAGLLLVALWGLLFSMLRAIHDTGWARHLGPLSALLVLAVGLLHRRWYAVERPRWWARLNAARVRVEPTLDAHGPDQDPSDLMGRT